MARSHSPPDDCLHVLRSTSYEYLEWFLDQFPHVGQAVADLGFTPDTAACADQASPGAHRPGRWDWPRPTRLPRRDRTHGRRGLSDAPSVDPRRFGAHGSLFSTRVAVVAGGRCHRRRCLAAPPVRRAGPLVVTVLAQLEEGASVELVQFLAKFPGILGNDLGTAVLNRR